MVCQKLCQNSVSGWGPLEESNSYLFSDVNRSYLADFLTFGGVLHVFSNIEFAIGFVPHIDLIILTENRVFNF